MGREEKSTLLSGLKDYGILRKFLGPAKTDERIQQAKDAEVVKRQRRGLHPRYQAKKAAACRSSPDHRKQTDGSAATRHFSCIVLVCIPIYIHTSLFETMRIEVYEMRLHICLKCANSLC